MRLRWFTKLKKQNVKREVAKALPRVCELRRLASGGLVGFSGVCVVALLGVGHIDLPLHIALYAFAVAIPILVKDLADVKAEETHNLTINLRSRITGLVWGMASSMVGVVTIFYHFSELLAVIFAVACCLCVHSYTAYDTELEKEAKARDEYSVGANSELVSVEKTAPTLT